MTFNIHHGEGIDKKLDFERIAKLIRDEKADLVALQEVDKGVGRSGNTDVAGEIARMAGMSCVFSNNHSLSNGQYGNAILTRFPIKSRDHRLLPKKDSTSEQRGWLKTVVEVNGREVSFWNTHIDHRADEGERLKGVAKFVAWVKEEKTPIIFCGDFNAVPTSRTYQQMKEAFDDSWEKIGSGEGYTIPVHNPNRRIDYVFVSKGAPIEPLRAWVPRTEASDHLPIVVEFKWK